MTLALVTTCVMLGFGAVVPRGRGVALAFVTAQSLLLALVAADHALEDPELAGAAVALAARAIAIAVILAMAIRRTREDRPVPAGIAPMARTMVALVAMLAIPPLLPSLGLDEPRAQDAAVALVVLGIVIALTRRATVVQILGFVVAENGATLLALSVTDRVPQVIELGVVFDLLLVTVVATAFHTRIFGQFGSGDAAQLRGLHD